MSILFWGIVVAMLIMAIGFVAVPLRTGKSLLATPKVLLGLFFPLSVVGLYALIGSPNHIGASKASIHTVPTAAASGSLGTVESMVDGLAARLAQEPSDADGWILLARSYQYLDRDSDALSAYVKAQALGKSDADLEALILGKATAEQVQPVSEGTSLRGRVALSPAALQQVQAGDTLFIFAKESRDDRMPVVALRRNVSDMPFEFSLTDKEMMIPGQQLSDFGELVVTAKISRTGNAADNSLGLEAWSDPVSPSDKSRIDLMIGTRNE
ncbi:MAG: hypothetical protein K0U72_12325 [Gammaproteobacteria bacterium]|nr:hypothetical protein [Gammaproteobacteria bacterium]